MGAFDRIEGREDCEASRLKLEAKTKRIARDNLLACPHRKPKRSYVINALSQPVQKCEHPERAKGRLCVQFDCPVIDFI